MDSTNSTIMGGINPIGGIENSATQQLGTVLGDNQKSNVVYYRPKVEQYVREYKKVQRNDPCPCGSTDENGKPKKYKHCCLETGIYEG